MRRGAVAPADVVGRLSSPPVRQGSAQRERERVGRGRWMGEATESGHRLSQAWTPRRWRTTE
jgi:hypothetical protein